MERGRAPKKERMYREIAEVTAAHVRAASGRARVQVRD